MRHTRSRPLLLTLLGGLLCLAPLAAQDPAPPPSGPADVYELEAFLDGVMAATLDAYHIAGGTISVVRDGRPLFARGYGFSDLEKRTRVSPETTLFRIGSISKLFVWTAVMQLVEEGRLDLNADVNTYLVDFKIPPTFPRPVTLRSLMTHTPGFEEHVVGLFARDQSSLRPLGQILALELPSRVRPPDEISSYSNHGTGLAAHVVERVSGMRWDDYVEARILTPLAMARTTFRQPVPATFPARVSKGYRFAGGEFREEPFEYVPLAPVGAASTTATDITNFMIAHLQLGRFGDSRILSETTAQTMHEVLFRHAPEVNAMAHGFIDMSMNGQRVIGHGGDTLWFHSELALLPEHQLGFFVSFNSDGGGRATGRVYREFMNHYFPAGEARELKASPDNRAALERFGGTYRPARYSHTDFTKLAAAVQVLSIAITPEGELKVVDDEAVRFVQSGPLAFREKHGGRTIAFREDARGRVTHLFLGDLPVIAFEKVEGLDLPPAQPALALFALVVFGTTILFWPVAARVRKHYYITLPEGARVPRAARLVAWFACLSFIAFLVCLSAAMAEPNLVVFGTPMMLRIGIVFSTLAALLTLGVLAGSVWVWVGRRGSLWGRLAYSIVALALVSAVWQAWHWNLIGVI
jgi:CubicO group peptidase (beta-lactamase class C family)